MTSEKRKFHRKNIEVKVQCHATEDYWTKATARSFNISQSGMVLRLKKSFGHQKTVMLTITNPYWKEPVTAKAKVVWEADIPGTDEKKVGLEFTKVSWDRITQMWGVIKD